MRAKSIILALHKFKILYLGVPMKKNIVIGVIIILLFATCLSSGGQIVDKPNMISYQYTNINKDERQQNHASIPTWTISDTWMYETHIYSDTENGLFDISSDDLRMTITNNTTQFHQNKTEKIYNVRINGNVTGTFSSSILSGDITGVIHGNVSMRQADLSMLSSNITSSGIIEYLIILESDYLIESNAEYFPSFEYFDFPIKTDEEWNITTTAHQNSSFYMEDFYDNQSESTSSMDGYAECINKEIITVPAGSFSTFHLLSQQENASIESWFSSEIKNVAKLYMNSTNETDTSKIWMNLTSYSLYNQQVNITSAFSPSEVNIDDPVTLSGHINETSTGNPVQNTNVSIEIPYTNTSFLVKTDHNGYYTHTFIAPLILDPTNTSYDIGSDGVIISVNSPAYLGYKIDTLTVIGVAIDNVQAHPTVQFETVPVNISGMIYHVEDLVEKTISISGPAGFTHMNVTLQSAGKDKYYHNQSYSIIGNYSFYLWAKDRVGNTNRSKTFTFSIIPDTIPPEIENIQITPNIQYENYSLTISCDITDNVQVNNTMVIITNPYGSITNNSMIYEDNIYQYTSSFNETGNYSGYIWTNDTLGNSNSSTPFLFSIIPEIPVIKNIHAQPNPQNIDGFVNITCDVFDQNGIDKVKVNITGPSGFSPLNETMILSTENKYFYKNNYSHNGTYDYSIWVLDVDGNTNETILFSFEIVNQTYINFNISLLSGWNLITIPVNTSMWASDLAENVSGCTSVSKWNASLQTYDTYIVGGPPTFDFPIRNGHGYFVDMSNSDTLVVQGMPIDNVSIPLEVGWNLLGWYHEDETTASSFAENITGSTSVSKWNASLQTYDTYIVGGPPTFDFIVTRGMGLFVDVDETSTWYGQG